MSAAERRRDRDGARLRRENETAEQRAARLEQNREAARIRRSEETSERRAARLEQDRNRARIRRANEREAQRAARRQLDSDHHRLRRQNSQDHTEELNQLQQRRRIQREDSAQETAEANAAVVARARYQRPTDFDLERFESDPTSALRRFCDNTHTPEPLFLECLAVQECDDF
jgi:hypothetical protein